MSNNNQTNLLISSICAVIGFFVLSAVFNSIGIYTGWQLKEQGGSPVPFWINTLFLVVFIIGLV